jgi:hypothetical protein
MLITSRLRSNAAARVALAVVVVAATLAGAAPSYAAPGDPCTKHFPVSDYSCTQQGYPNPEYPNHQPLRGNYPGTYASTSSTPADPADSDFDWRAAAVGAAGMLGLILLLAAARATARMTRNRSRRIPFVVDVRDETPTSS